VPPYEPIDADAEIARARRRVGTTPESRTRWLLHFETLNLEQIDLRPVRYEWSVFYNPEADRPSIGETDAEQQLSRIQNQVRNGFSRLRHGQSWSHNLVTSMALWIPRAEQWTGGTRLDSRSHIEPRAPHRLHTARHEHQHLPHVIARLLEAVGPRLRRCALPGCLTLFVQRGRQRFCTETHAARYRTWKRRGTLPVVPTGPDPRRGAQHLAPLVDRQKRGRGWSRARERDAGTTEDV
jgi:hypothetical protein